MSSSRILSDEAEVQLRLGYLGMIQNVIARLSGFSATVKTAAVTVFAAMLALDMSGAARVVTLPLIMATFGLLDSYYITRERAFRDLYDAAASRSSIGLQDLTMAHGSNKVAITIGAAASVAVLGFYLPLIAVAVAASLFVERASP